MKLKKMNTLKILNKLKPCLSKERTLNKKMKKNYSTLKMLLTVVFCLFVWIPSGICQNESPAQKKLSIKPYYAVEANFGISIFNEREYSASNETLESKLAYQTLVYGANFVGGVELTHYFKVGLGIGYFYYKQKDKRYPYSAFYIPNSMTTHGIPLFLYLRSDFLDRKISPYVDIKIGNNFLITKETIDFSIINFPAIMPVVENIGTYKLRNGLFLAPHIGVAFKTNSKATIDVSIGYQYVSRNYDMPYSVGKVSPDMEIKYAKTGNITADHQFLLGVGVSF